MITFSQFVESKDKRTSYNTELAKLQNVAKSHGVEEAELDSILHKAGYGTISQFINDDSLNKYERLRWPGKDNYS